MGVFVSYVVLVFDGQSSRSPLLDLNGDGATTIMDVLMLLWGGFYIATMTPLIVGLWALDEIAPQLLSFFEVQRVLDWLGNASVLLGFASWVGLLFGVAKIEIEVRDFLHGQTERWRQRRIERRR
jgi:hypothetical protein